MGVGAYGSIYTVKGLQLLRAWGIDPQHVDGGNIRIKEKRCGKPKCGKCPHAYYAYHRNRWGEKYLGPCDRLGNPREKFEPVKKLPKQTKLLGISKISFGRK